MLQKRAVALGAEEANLPRQEAEALAAIQKIMPKRWSAKVGRAGPNAVEGAAEISGLMPSCVPDTMNAL